MRNLFLLLCAQPIISTFASSLSNAWSSASSVIHYTVYPIHPGRNDQTTKTETLLKDIYGDTNVVPSQRDIEHHGQVTDSWRVTSTDSSDLTTAIKALEGVRRVVRVDLSDTHAIRRDDGPNFVAMANTSFDWHKTEEFLKSKVRNGIQFFPMKDWDDRSQVVGWYDLALDPDAKTAVEQHEGIHSVSVMTNLVDFLAIPPNDRPRFSQNIDQTHEQNSKLFTRDGKWEKQENADKALVMDSQFA